MLEVVALRHGLLWRDSGVGTAVQIQSLVYQNVGVPISLAILGQVTICIIFLHLKKGNKNELRTPGGIILLPFIAYASEIFVLPSCKLYS